MAIINISHSKGGVGKSSAAFNLAVSLQKQKPIIVDLDVQKTLTVTNQIRVNNKLKKLDVAAVKTGEDFKSLIKSSDDELVIIDSGGYDSALGRAAITVSDLIITPVSDSTVELIGLRTYEGILRELSEVTGETIKAHVLLNNIDPRAKRFDALQAFITKSDHFEMLETIIRRRSAFRKSIEQGQSVREYEKGGKAAGEIKNLLKEVRGLLDI